MLVVDRQSRVEFQGKAGYLHSVRFAGRMKHQIAECGSHNMEVRMHSEERKSRKDADLVLSDLGGWGDCPSALIEGLEIQTAISNWISKTYLGGSIPGFREYLDSGSYIFPTNIDL
jgi:hypothetical protein